MTAFSQAVGNPRRRRIRLWTVLVLVLMMVAPALIWDRTVSGQTPAPQALGPYVADFLLPTGGSLDANGTGAQSLATGTPSITTGRTCFAGYCGTLTITNPLLLRAYSWWHQRNVQSTVPPGDPPVWWYNDGTYYFQVDFNDYAGFSTEYSCAGFVTQGTALYYVNFKSSANINCPNGQNWDGAGNPTTYRVKGDQVKKLWEQFRGAGGLNVSIPPDQTQANLWTRTWIGELGRWTSVVKPALDAVIRAAASSADLQGMGITGNPPLDEPPQARRIAIDAGHAEQPLPCRNATGPTWGDREDVLVLEIAQQVAADFRARGHTVIETRPTTCTIEQDENGNWKESFESLKSRAQTATNGGAEIFVSIHLNGFPTLVKRGTEVWYDPRPGKVASSLDLARFLVNRQAALPLPKRPAGVSGEEGIKLADYPSPNGIGDLHPFVVLSFASQSIPAVIDEVAFLNNGGPTGNNQDECLLHQDPTCDPNQNFRRRAANAIESAIREFFP